MQYIVFTFKMFHCSLTATVLPRCNRLHICAMISCEQGVSLQQAGLSPILTTFKSLFTGHFKALPF